jgi:hypothetical protein
MRSIVVFLPLAMLGLLSLAGCSQGKSSSALPAEPADAANSTGNCTVQLTGNTSGSQALPNCGDLSISRSDDGTLNVVLGFHFSTTKLQTLDVSIVLGSSPSVGSYSSRTSSKWSVVGTTSSQCQYVAGSESVPRGSFQLTLSSIEIVDAGAGDSADSGAEAGSDASTDSGVDSDADPGMSRSAGTAHGTLELTLSVHAPPATDCGAGDGEQVIVQF